MLTPFAKRGLKTLGKEAVRVGKSVAADALSGADPLQSLEEHGKESAVRMLNKIGKTLDNKSKQGGVKKRRKRQRTKKDIFDSI